MGEKTVEKPKKKDAQALSHKAKRREIELKKAELELRSTEIDLEMDQLSLASRKDERKKKANEDTNLGIFALESGVGAPAVSLASEIRRWARRNPGKPITLNIFSPGGSLLHGLVLYDTLRALSSQGHSIVTHVRGYAASMGGLIALAGDVRLIGGESLVMIHSLSAGGGGSLHELEDDLKFYKLLQSRLDKIVTSRTKIGKKLLAESTKKADWWLTPEDALRLGVVHEVL
jgi:ATP-dependent Clp protease protease subunit